MFYIRNYAALGVGMEKECGLRRPKALGLVRSFLRKRPGDRRSGMVTMGISEGSSICLSSP